MINNISDTWQKRVEQANKPPSFWQRIKDVFWSTETPASNMEQAIQCFEAHLKECLQEISISNPGVSKEKAESAFKALASSIRLINARGGPVRQNELNAAIGYADRMGRALLSVLRLPVEPPTAKGAIQVVRPRDGEFNVIQAAEMPKNTVYEGGGAKGGMYVWIRLLQWMMGFPQPENCAGTSAGSIIAALQASGNSVDTLMQITANMPMTSYLNTGPGFADRYPHANLSGRRLGCQAGDAIGIVDEMTSLPVRNYLNEHWNEPRFQARLQLLPTSQQERLKQLRDQRMEGSRQGSMLTFGDLAMLHTLAPETFSKLSVCVWNNQTASTVVLNDQTSPDLEVAFAVRASMAIPWIFWPIVLNLAGMADEYSDGGQGSNLPVESFLAHLHPNGKGMSDTAGMAFSRGGWAYEILHSPPGERPEVGWLLGLLLGEGYKENCLREAQKIHDLGPNVVVVKHKNVGTLTFKPKPLDLIEAITEALEGYAAHLENTHHQAFFTTHSTPEECYAQCTLEQKLWLRAQPINKAMPSGTLSRDELLALHFFRQLVEHARNDKELEIEERDPAPRGIELQKTPQGTGSAQLVRVSNTNPSPPQWF